MVVSSITATVSILWRRGCLQSAGREEGLKISPFVRVFFLTASAHSRASRDKSESDRRWMPWLKQVVEIEAARRITWALAPHFGHAYVFMFPTACCTTPSAPHLGHLFVGFVGAGSWTGMVARV